jgi:hypothetical protein
VVDEAGKISEEGAVEKQEPKKPEPDQELTPDEYVALILSEEERLQAEKISSTDQKICRLKTADELIAALKGSCEERAILIRDSNGDEPDR